MSLLSIFLLVIFVIACLIMILIILLQDDQGEGLGGLFGGGSSTPFGSRSGNILTRFTAIMAAVFIVGAFALAWLNRSPESADIVEKARLERLRAAEEQNWWVERIEGAPAPPPQVEAAPEASEAQAPASSEGAGESADAPAADSAAGGINR